MQLKNVKVPAPRANALYLQTWYAPNSLSLLRYAENMGEEIDGSVSCNKETWINEQSKLGDMVSWFLVVLQ